MTSTGSSTVTVTFTAADEQKVVAQVTADLVMIASSSRAISEEEARQYGHDIEYLAGRGYLEWVDVTLLDGIAEVTAVRFNFVSGVAATGSARAGGVLWPRVAVPKSRVLISYTSVYTDDLKKATLPKLKIPWTPTNADASHSGLSTAGGRAYSSHGFGAERKDFK